MANAKYNEGKLAILNGEIQPTTDTLKVMLLDNTYTANIDTHQNKDDIDTLTVEISGTGYTAGGQALAGVSVTTDNVNDLAVVDANDVVWTNATITARYALVYLDTGTPSTSTLLGLFDFGTDITSTNADFTIQWGTGGIYTLT